MALNNFKCNHLMPLHFKGLNFYSEVNWLKYYRRPPPQRLMTTQSFIISAVSLLLDARALYN